MSWIVDNPFILFVIALSAQWSMAYLGDLFRRTVRSLGKVEREDFDTVLAATLTLFALIIGFSFSMAVSRYDQRKNCEEAEANAIGTEYVRADLLLGDKPAIVQDLLRKYAANRVLFYQSGSVQPAENHAIAEAVESELWSVIAQTAKEQATPIVALAVSGMNDVLNSQGYTQAAWWNRIPTAAWELMALMALVANLLLGYRERKTGFLVLLVLPLVSSVAFFLIADIDSPGGGIIRVTPHNLIAVARLMNAR